MDLNTAQEEMDAMAIRGPKPMQPHIARPTMDCNTLGGSSPQQAHMLAGPKSPTKSPTKRRQVPVLDIGSIHHDDVVPDSTRSNDQRAQTQSPQLAAAVPAAATPATAPQNAAAQADKPNKYIELLHMVYPAGKGTKLPSSSSSSMTARQAGSSSKPAAASSGARSSSSAAAPAAGESSVPLLVRSSSTSKTTPLSRAPRSRISSILDSSPGAPSLIPSSPASAAAPTAAAGLERNSVLRNSGGSIRAATGSLMAQSLSQASPTKAMGGGSLARRSVGSAAPAAAARPQYAFGSRVDTTTSQRKPSPMRQSAGSTAAANQSRESPQRVPAAARRSAPAAGPLRSASAPRMSSADKGVQSRFAQHQASAIAAQRSKTPNPAARASAAAGGTATVAGSRVRPAAASVSASSTAGAAAGRSIARMRASSSDAGSRLPGASSSSSFGGAAGRSASPSTAMRAASRSMPAAAGAAGSISKTAAGSNFGASPTKPKPVAPAASRMGGPRAERVSVIAAATAGSPLASAGSRAAASAGSCIGIPTIQDRYKSSYGKHTPAAMAVAAANAAAGAAGASPAEGRPAVPKLQLNTSLLGSPVTPGLLRSREREQASSSSSNSNIPSPLVGRAPAVVKGAAGAEAQHQQDGGVSPFLGRISAVAPGPVNNAHKPLAASHTLQQQQQHISLLPLHSSVGANPGSLIPPSPSAGCSNFEFTPTRAPEKQPWAASVASGSCSKAAGAGEHMSPPLLPRELSGASVAAEAAVAQVQSEVHCVNSEDADVSRESGRQLESFIPSLANEASDSAVAVAAKVLVLPLHKLEAAADGEFSSPPRHRRGESSSPKGAAMVCSQLLKSKASSVCSSTAASKGQVAGSSSSASVPGTAAAAAAAAGSDVDGGAAPGQAGGYAAAAAAARRRAGTAAVAAGKDQAASCLDAVTPKGPGVGSLKAMPGTSPGSKAKSSCSPGEKLRGLVPRLDLTPVHLLQADDQQADQGSEALEQQHQGPLLLEYHEPRRLTLDDDEEQPEEELHRSRTRPGLHDGKPQSAGRSAAGKRGASAGGSGRRTSSSSKRSSAPEEPPPPESYYVYESVMPQEETKTYEELRRVLQKCPGGNKLVANLQGIWCCYQDARRNTEAMAFRGHRLLDQVSNEYCAYKRESEQEKQQLRQERDAYKEEWQLALSGSAGGADTDLAHRDKLVRDLQHENQELRLQKAEMEKALQMAADRYHSQQADLGPVKAQAIATSATTSILFQQTVAQQEELLKSKKTEEDLKAALMLACGALKQTNYMDPDGHVRATLHPDMLQVVDILINSTEAEASMLDQVHAVAAAAGAVQPHVQIEELQDGADV